MPMYMPRQPKLSAFNRWTASDARGYSCFGASRPSLQMDCRECIPTTDYALSAGERPEGPEVNRPDRQRLSND
jgi:hypothetical protein